MTDRFMQPTGAGHFLEKAHLLITVLLCVMGLSLVFCLPVQGQEVVQRQEIYIPTTAGVPTIDEVTLSSRSSSAMDAQRATSRTGPWGFLAASEDALPSLSQVISVCFREATVEEALKAIAEEADLQLSYSNRAVAVGKEVRLDLEQVTAHTALEAVLRGTGIDMVVSHSGQIILTPGPEATPRSVVLRRASPAPGRAPAPRVPKSVKGLQTGTITGTVTDAESGEPVPGANVAVVDQNRGAATNIEGQYTIEAVPVGEQTIAASYVGYQRKTRTVEVVEGETATVNFELSSSALGLEEVVVTGQAGQARQKEVGNAVSQVDMSEIKEIPVNTSSLLQGRVPSLTVSEASGGAGSGSYLRLRGNVSITQSNFPLVYLDGVRVRSRPYPDNTAPGRGNGTAVAASLLNMINPINIKNIEVIKGASATTLYGSEASAGVIQIFTKDGQYGDSGNPRWTAQYTTTMDDMLKYGTEEFPYLRMGPFLRNSFGQEFSLSTRGGTQDVSYFLSGQYQNDDAVLPLGNEEAYGLRGNVSFKATSDLNIQWNTALTRRDITNTPQGNSVGSLPLNAYRADKNYVGGAYPDAHRALLDYELTSDILHAITGATLRYQATSNWLHRLTGGYDVSYLEHRNLRPFGFVNYPQGFLNVQRWSDQILTLDYNTSYALDLTDNLTNTLSAGGQYINQTTASTDASSESFPGPSRPTLSSGAIQSTVGTRIRKVNAGVYVQNRLGIADRLFLTGGLRLDGNSAFGEALGLQLYPKLSASYVISESGIWDQDWGTLKLRAAFGQAGRAPGAFDAIRTWSPIRYGGEPGFLPLNLGNPGLAPERSTELEGGFDGNFLDGRLTSSFTYYYRRTTDALFPVRQMPSQGGWENQLENVGDMESRGLEFEINGTPVRGQVFTWGLGFALSTNHSEVLDLGEASQFQLPGGPAFVVEGQPAPVIRGYEVTNPNEQADPEYELKFYGPNVPTTNLTASTSLNYRGITLNARVEYQGGHYVLNRLAEGMVQRDVDWPPCYPVFDKIEEGGVESLTALERSQCVGSAVREPSFIEEGDFLKLRSVTLQLPIPFLEQMDSSLEGMDPTLTLSARNIWKWTAMPYLDPEMAGQHGASDFVRTIRDNIPPPAVYSAALRVNF